MNAPLEFRFYKIRSGFLSGKSRICRKIWPLKGDFKTHFMKKSLTQKIEKKRTIYQNWKVFPKLCRAVHGDF